MTPKQLSFASPQDKTNSPSSSVISDVSSLSSTSVTPDFAKLALGRRRGRPRKVLELPKTDDYPVDGTEEEKDKYIKKKNTELWRFRKLSLESCAEYRAAENERVKAYNKKKKDEASKVSSESDSDRKKLLSRERCIYM